MTKFTDSLNEVVALCNAMIGVLNDVHTNVWAVLLVILAVGLFHVGRDSAALAITTGAFAMLQAQEKK
jgi:uncharacterized membrane protein